MHPKWKTPQWGRLEGKETVVPIVSPFHPEEQKDRPPLTLDEVKLLAPVKPSKIVAVGLNYADHIAEMGNTPPPNPIIFIKPQTAVIGPGEHIVLPPSSQRVDYEAELGVVIGKKCRSVTPQEAPSFILGYTCFNDVTARDLQKKDGQWTRAKSFDTFAPLGPWINTNLDPSALHIECRLNGELKQSSSTSNLLFSVFELVAFISEIMTLLPGDVIATGTPQGVGPMKDGDLVEVYVEGIGTLSNPVKAG
ncbi:fumarylacetoacetate hydrolase family protein [Thermatribacter velox]|uniref:Fumarylacetoacetate hydrolase family protein n=1 Tax=Thermatribacter velox TaxID=3039681 RepID=A0ABZ2YDN9_9BACT